jgi:3-methylcrotonyl-CoA carboxylase alpha subunit
MINPSSSPIAAKSPAGLSLPRVPWVSAPSRSIPTPMRKALHVRSADEAVHIGPSAARESYLVGEKIIAAAKATGAEAIHPGYGFLSENAEFAQAVIDAGLVWVGPKPASDHRHGAEGRGQKADGRGRCARAPPAIWARIRTPASCDHAGEIGYPVLIKAVAGGGGKGMRLVESDGRLRRRARLLPARGERLVRQCPCADREVHPAAPPYRGAGVRRQPRQRRPPVRARLLAAAPSPEGDRGSPRPRHGRATREAVCAAAVRAAKAVDYVGAGTIEFIADGSEGLRADRIWFMEMNTRLQVEHPVTEEITGVRSG